MDFSRCFKYQSFKYHYFQSQPYQTLVRTPWAIALALSIAFMLLWITLVTISAQAQTGETGQAYVVQSGDSLSAIAQRFYGDGNAWRAIVDATNARAEEDSRFRVITTPSLIRTGQRLWLPNVSENAPVAVATATSQPPAAQSPATVPTDPTLTPTLTPSPTSISPQVFFVSPASGATISQTTVITMAAVGMTIEPAGAVRADAGHMHILVDTDFVPADELIINDGQHLHYGQGELTTTLTLEPGEHILRLQFANGAHIALDGPQYRDEISVTVAAEESSPAVRFVSPVDGETVESPLAVEMAAVGMTVEPAGEIRANAGHLHILVDTDFVPADELIINDGQHLHYGQGELMTTLDLEPGEHTLRLQFANGAHIALDGDQYRDEINVTVVAAEEAEQQTTEDAGDEPEAAVRFVSPVDGEAVESPLSLTMEAVGLEIEPAGRIRPGAGHLHLLVDSDFVPAGELMINDEQHFDYDQGELNGTLTLPPGRHVLRVQVANGAHVALEGEQYRDEIVVIVQE